MLLRIVLVVLGPGLLCVAYGVFVERRWFRLTRYRVDILPADGPESLTVLHLSDLHYVRGDRKMARFLTAIPTPDLTVVTGDIVGEPEAVEESVAVLAGVRGRLASYFVLGSNDYYVPAPFNYFRYFLPWRTRRKGKRGRAAELVAQLEASGWVHLGNVRRDVGLDGLAMEVAGLDDPHIGRHDLRVVPRRSPERFGLAVVHSPDAAPELVALGYDFVVAGHTHGGQVRLPLVGALVTNSHLPRRLSSGLIRMGPAYLHISPGMGTSKFAPFRFLCRPEATLLDFRRRPAGQASAIARSKTRS